MSYFNVLLFILGLSWIHHCQYCQKKTELRTTTLLPELKTEDIWNFCMPFSMLSFLKSQSRNHLRTDYYFYKSFFNHHAHYNEIYIHDVFQLCKAIYSCCSASL